MTRRWKAERELEVEKERERERRGLGMGLIEGVGRDEELVMAAPGKKRKMIDRGEREVVEIVEEHDEGIAIRNDRTAVTTGRKRKGRA